MRIIVLCVSVRVCGRRNRDLPEGTNGAYLRGSQESPILRAAADRNRRRHGGQDQCACSGLLVWCCCRAYIVSSTFSHVVAYFLCAQHLTSVMISCVCLSLCLSLSLSLSLFLSLFLSLYLTASNRMREADWRNPRLCAERNDGAHVGRCIRPRRVCARTAECRCRQGGKEQCAWSEPHCPPPFASLHLLWELLDFLLRIVRTPMFTILSEPFLIDCIHFTV